MRATILLATAAAAITLVAGCIVSDELTTITIRPDGTAVWVRFQSNIHSTEQGAKGAEELKKFIEEFDAHKNSDHVRIAEAGGEILESRWIERAEPYANLVKARFPTAAVLENFCTIKNEKDEVVAQARFTLAGNRRKLSLIIPVPREDQPATKIPPTFQEFRTQQANGISETRIVVAGGQITASQGFVVAADKRSCLMDPTQIDELIRSRPEQVELFVAWELDGR